MGAQQRLRRAVEQHGPARQDDDALGGQRRLIHAAGRGDDRPASGPEPPAKAHEIVPGRRVQIRRSVVEDDELRLQREHRRDAGALALPA
ncbi:hypothetical protein ACE41H_17585 [Paenibacillus enshidis]|uniref:Uncharacterized protein n=1 Tax=Paenibacillus enshidis TaxID=1458439 RepID=A0ABV5AWI3_9BACL